MKTGVNMKEIYNVKPTGIYLNWSSGPHRAPADMVKAFEPKLAGAEAVIHQLKLRIQKIIRAVDKIRIKDEDTWDRECIADIHFDANTECQYSFNWSYNTKYTPNPIMCVITKYKTEISLGLGYFGDITGNGTYKTLFSTDGDEIKETVHWLGNPKHPELIFKFIDEFEGYEEAFWTWYNKKYGSASK